MIPTSPNPTRAVLIATCLFILLFGLGALAQLAITATWGGS